MSADLCKPIYDINYLTSTCPFESGKCGKGKITEIWISQESFFDEIKNIFYSFWRATIWWKNKKSKK